MFFFLFSPQGFTISKFNPHPLLELDLIMRKINIGVDRDAHLGFSLLPAVTVK